MKYLVCPLKELFPVGLKGHIDVDCYEKLRNDEESSGGQVILIAPAFDFSHDDIVPLNLELRAHGIDWVCYHENDETLNGQMSTNSVVSFPG